MSAEGLVSVRSNFPQGETLSRLETEIRARGMTIFAHVDHAAGAEAVGLMLRPTDLLIFGAAKGGTPLMQSQQTVGIDLPLKALVWKDESGTTFVSYNDPVYLVRRHGLDGSAKAVTEALSAALEAVAAKATSGP